MKKLTLILTILLLAACEAASTETPSLTPPPPTAEPTTEPISQLPAIEPTLSPTTFIEPPASPTKLPTVTSPPTNTPSPTATAVPTDTPTPTETPTNTTVPITPTPTPTETPTPPPLPEIPNYPNTPVQPWDQGMFITSVQPLPGHLHMFYDYFGRISTGTQGYCYEFWGTYYEKWERAPAFTDVPPDWQIRYTEYRAILHETRIAVFPIIDLCTNGGGFLNDETEQVILDAIFNLEVRARQLEADVLGG